MQPCKKKMEKKEEKRENIFFQRRYLFSFQNIFLGRKLMFSLKKKSFSQEENIFFLFHHFLSARLHMKPIL